MNLHNGKLELKRAKYFGLWFAVLILSLLNVTGESYWDGLVSYNPPLPMWCGTQAGNAGVPINGFELRSEGITNGYAQVTFQISSMMLLYDRERPDEEIKTIADLKKHIEATKRNEARATNRSISVIKFDGKDAICTTNLIAKEGPAPWFYGVSFFWRQEPVWLRGSLFSIYFSAEKRETLDKLVTSLKTVKIRDTPPPVKLAKDGMQLGFTQDETRKLCGEPLDTIGPNETYITAKYLIEIRFDPTSDDKLALISYSKVRDPQKAAATNHQGRVAQSLPLSKNEVEQILKRHTDNGRFRWSIRWKRSDDAMAAFVQTNLVIADAQMWRRLSISQQ